MDTIWIITESGTDICGDSYTTVVGYVTTYEEAQKACEDNPNYDFESCYPLY